MIADFKTNTVYIADSTTPAFQKRLSEVYKDFKVLKGTNDWFCRDYMPVQIADKEFVQFVYKPKDYHRTNEYGLISNPIVVALESSLEPAIGRITYSRIILDGGNVVRASKKVIVTDKVLEDNSYHFNNDADAIIDELEKALNCDVILIPKYPNEKTGHADGLIRFIDDSTVMVNEEDPSDPKEWLKEFYRILDLYHLNYERRVKCTVPSGVDHALGLYINFLQLDHQIIVPRFDKKEDDTLALENTKTAFGTGGGYNFQQMYAGDIAIKGGVLNCATWTIYQPNK